ncbi:glycosyltransferase family 2 protein [Dyadobacter subterraneus]|uniref:Glycosyltransferase n=1 Tax=Dyadobacter subterraneus TaxID=2773304 RepID=A0ABR9WJP2_9BACT|nr:glycosyltransferase [Dyadobacter subterraneus]MBE9465710.1 glycosyltransferase [Dyadobacter subterraneus]
MDVSIIIINYRTPQLIINCLTSIYQYTYGVKFEIIVVDNDPENGGKNIVLEKYPEINWIDMEYNSGFGRANNAGMKAAKGRYFLILNADTLVTDNVIGRCMQRMEQQKEISAAGALQQYADGSAMPFYKSFNEFHKTFFILPPSGIIDRILNKLYPEPIYNNPGQCDWLVGAFIFVRREAAELSGRFDEDFFMYGEDVEWSGRLAKQGQLRYFNDCTFIHLENDNPFRRTSISWINRFSTQMQVSNMLWLRKQYGVGAYLLMILHYISMIPVLFLWKMLFSIKQKKNPFGHLKTQIIFTRKTMVLLHYFWPTLFAKRRLYKIKPSENIDLLTIS